MIKLYRRTSRLILVLLQIAFVTAIFYDVLNEFSVLVFIGVIGFLALFSLVKMAHESHEKPTKSYILILFVTLGALFTFIINLKFETGPVIAAAFIGTLATLTPTFFRNKENKIIKEIPPAVYCGTFVGMTSAGIGAAYWFIILSGFIAGILYVLATNTFVGVGGKLGTIAFGGVASVFLLSLIIR
ncbi:hypothetical protein [Gillisia hiemivivida]|uniref:Uncharacterized protein n=1 Tax=Gillisia hiemivivida TaxID=291190 RepID=A0A5C6ZUB2_9FLAO|nr:hypothetical protein [Gillisia hiemivivida]TXD92776.1 hypothetical protein ES724_12665 [Gillisia hiemivivida]